MNTSSAYRVCAAADVPPDEGLKVSVPGRADIAVFRVGETFCVVDDECTHERASLTAEGYQDKHVIECGWHACRFDLRSGAVLSPPCITALRTYPARIEGADVVVDEADLFAASS